MGSRKNSHCVPGEYGYVELANGAEAQEVTPTGMEMYDESRFRNSGCECGLRGVSVCVGTLE